MKVRRPGGQKAVLSGYSNSRCAMRKHSSVRQLGYGSHDPAPACLSLAAVQVPDLMQQLRSSAPVLN